MKKLMTMIGVAAAAFGLYAADLTDSMISFEGRDPGLPDEGSKFDPTQDGLWFGYTDDTTLEVKEHETTVPHKNPDIKEAYDEDNLNYLWLEADAPVFRTFADVPDEEGTMDPVAIEDTEAERGGIIADQLVKLSAFDKDTTVELEDGAKIAVWLKTLTEGPTEEDNTYALMVTCGALDSDYEPTEATVQLDLGDSLDVKPGEWHQLTITAIKALELPKAGAIAGFKVAVDGVVAKADSEVVLFPEGWEVVATDEAKTLIPNGELFPSFVKYDDDYAMTLQGIAFKGTGAVDDIAIKAKPLAPVADYVAEIGDTKYETLAEAVAAADGTEDIVLLKSCSGNGIIINKSVTIDFNDCTYTVDKDPLAGSEGTKSQAFQLLAGNTIVFQNGTITSSDAVKMLVQNYSNLTLDSMTLDGTNMGVAHSAKTGDVVPNYTLSNNNGEVLVQGSTIISKGEGHFAFDVCGSSSYNGVTVKIDGGTITGDYEITGSKPTALYKKNSELKALDGFEWVAAEDGWYMLQVKKADEPLDPEQPKKSDDPTGDAAKMNNEDGTVKVECIKIPEAAGTSDEAKAAYAQLFRAVPGDGVVTIEFTEAAEAAIEGEITAAQATVIAPDEDGNATIATKPGLYYGIAAVDEVGTIKTATPAEWEQATESSLKLAVPAPTKGDGTKAFYQVHCQAKDPTSNL